MHHTREQAAFTRRELIAFIGVTTVLLMLFLAPAVDRTKPRSDAMSCMLNLKQIGLASMLWANDHIDRFPEAVSISNGGWNEFFRRGDASSYLWTNYVAMGDLMGKSPSFLICPSDERMPATNFDALANTNISYFTGDVSSDASPRSILGGDRNLGPGTTPASDYGFSPADGKGSNVTVRGPVCWTLKMHSGKSMTRGNVLLVDGSAQMTTSGNLYNNWVKTALAATATNTAPSPHAIRLIFP